MYLANPPGYTSFTIFPQATNPLWADGTVLYYGNLRGEWMQGENSGKVLAHEVRVLSSYVRPRRHCPAVLSERQKADRNSYMAVLVCKLCLPGGGMPS